MRIQVAILLVLLLSMQSMTNFSLEDQESNLSYASAKATGVDLTVTDISYSYPDAVDRSKYQMFSSNTPPVNFNRPESLFVTDAVIDTQIEIQIEISNIGASNSPNLDLNVLIIHNEYQDFEIFNATNQVNSIRGQSNAISSFKLIPTYSGNHSIIITPSMSVVDDNPSNDIMMSTFTVASHYFNCDDLSLWTVGQEWGMNSESSLSQGSACHIGNGQSSTYSANLATNLITPVFDMSDAISNPSRTNGISFYYTGSLASGDFVRLYSMNPSNSWVELASITGTTSSDITTWQTWSVNNAGATSPLIPTPQSNFHANSQYRFGFTSDATNNDIGLWMDDIVIIYDQQLRQEEYGIATSGVGVNGAVPNSWGKATIQLTNTGNVSETFTPSLSGIPNDWQYYFSQTSGVSITESNGVYLEKGETKIIELNFQPRDSENQGFYPITFTSSSKTHQSISSSIVIQLEVIPDRIPEFLPQLSIARCIPGSSCVTSISITNSGGAPDVFMLSLDYDNLPIGWSVSFSWNQPTEILVQPGFSVPIMLTYTIGSDAVPDSIGTFDLIAVSENDSSRTDSINIELVASMISDATISPNIQQGASAKLIEPGGSEIVVFTVFNNASVQDIFETNVVFEGASNWEISDITPATLYLNSGDTSTFSAKFTAPVTAQVGDDCPGYLASIISQRSGEIFASNIIDNFEISQVNNIGIELLESPENLVPGSQNIISVELNNLGNGAVPVDLSINGIPDTWNTSFMMENQIVSSNVQLGEISELSSTKLIDIVINVPSGTDHSLIFEIDINAMPSMYGDDVDLSDNSVSINLFTVIVRDLFLSNNIQAISSGVGNSTTFYVDINNFGNVQESDLRIFANLYSDTYQGLVTAFMSLGNTGLTYEFNKYHPITIDKNSIRQIRIDLVIPDDIPIDSVIVFDFTLSSSSNEFETITHRTNILVDYVKEISTNLDHNQQTITEDFGYMWLNISTIATSDETYFVTFSTPQEWRLICDSKVIDENGIIIEDNIINSINRQNSIYCEVVNEGEIYDGSIAVEIYDSDNILISNDKVQYSFAIPIQDSTSFSPTTIGSFVVIGLIVAISVSIILVRRRSANEDDDTDIIKPVSGPPISGPPISMTNNNQIQSNNPVPTQNTNNSQHMDEVISPPIPETGLPHGWTIEQWKYYGQQYLDMNNRQ